MSSGGLLDEIQNTSDFLRRAKGGITLSAGEPLLQAHFTHALLRGCKEMKLHTALDMTGYLGIKASDAMLADIDLVLLDIKAFDPEVYRRVTGVELQPTLDFAQRLEALGKAMWIRFVLLPGLTDDPGNVNSLAEFVASLNRVERVEVIPFYKIGEFKWDELGMSYQLADTPPPTEESIKQVQLHFSSRGVLVV